MAKEVYLLNNNNNNVIFICSLFFQSLNALPKLITEIYYVHMKTKVHNN